MNEEKRDKVLGTHPVSTGLGAAAGGMAAGAAMGTVAGPLGTAAGATAGAILGGLAGKNIAAAVDPAAEDTYWKSKYSSAPYFQAGSTYNDYGPAYRTGYQGRAQYVGRKFDDVQHDLEANYNRTKGTSSLGWEKAKHAARAAWDRIERAMPGDSDHDGK